MAKCASWRPLEGATLSGDSAPGGKNRVWVPCRRRVARGVVRCDECLHQLLTHPVARVRRELAAEPGQSPDVLHVLATDGDPSVAQTAQQQLNAR